MYNIDKIDKIPVEEREFIIQAVTNKNITGKFSNSELEKLFKIYKKYILTNHSVFSLNCSTCRMKVNTTFSNFVKIWQQK